MYRRQSTVGYHHDVAHNYSNFDFPDPLGGILVARCVRRHGNQIKIMKKHTYLLLLAMLFALVLGVSGCATQIHSRQTYSETGQLLTNEETRWRFRAMDSSAAKVQVSTKDGDYERKVSATDAQSFADEETVEKLRDAAASITDALR